jgi:branched-chain amino acid transport system ATP-binding protein
MTELLRMSGLVVEYRTGLPVVNGISLEVGEAEIVGLFGRNGAGKTTSMRALFGLVARKAGRIELFGRELPSESKTHEIARMGATMVLEGRGIFADMTVEENLRSGMRPGDSRDRLREICERFPALAAKRKAPAGRLSGGEQQLLALARASLQRPRLLVVDEISLGLSPIAVKLAMEALRSLAAGGTGILIADQNVAAVSVVCTRACLMDRGRIVGAAQGSEALASQWAKDIYLGGAAAPTISVAT